MTIRNKTRASLSVLVPLVTFDENELAVRLASGRPLICGSKYQPQLFSLSLSPFLLLLSFREFTSVSIILAAKPYVEYLPATPSEFILPNQHEGGLYLVFDSNYVVERNVSVIYIFPARN